MVRKNFYFGGVHTTILLEPEFWHMLEEISHKENITISFLVNQVLAKAASKNRASALRTFVCQYFRERFQAFSTSWAYSCMPYEITLNMLPKGSNNDPVPARGVTAGV
jgi:predicted DNA-binding ribbon-helix-helix protein